MSRIHSNPPNSLIHRHVPIQVDLTLNATKHIALEFKADPLADMDETLGDKCRQYLLSLISAYVRLDYFDSPSYSYLSEAFWISLSNGSNLSHTYATSSSYLVLIGISNEELKSWKCAFDSDSHFQRVLAETEDRDSAIVSQYQLRENGLIYLEGWNGNF